MAWLKEEDDILIRMWAVPTYSASYIAGEIGGGKSRNAVIGRARRLKLASRRRAPSRHLLRIPKNGAEPQFRKPRKLKDKLTKHSCHISELTAERCHNVLEPIGALMYCGRPTVDGVWCFDHRALYLVKVQQARRKLS